jgi:hypothetical protein
MEVATIVDSKKMDKSTSTIQQIEVANLVHCEVQCDLQLGQHHHAEQQINLAQATSNITQQQQQQLHNQIQEVSVLTDTHKTTDRTQILMDIKPEIKPLVTGCKEATRQIAMLG